MAKFDFSRIVWDKKMVAGVVVVTLALLYGDIALLMRMQVTALSTMAPKLKKLKKDIVSLNKDLAEMLKSQKEALRQKDEPMLMKKLLNAEEFPLILDKVSLLGNAPGIKIMQLESVKEETQAPAAPRARRGKNAPAEEPPAPAKNENFSTWILNLDLSCDYHKLGVFLNQLDELPAVFYIQKLSIVPEGSVRQVANLELKAYVNK